MKMWSCCLAGGILALSAPVGVAHPLEKRSVPTEKREAAQNTPLLITVRTDKTRYKPGETIRAEVVLTNRSLRPVVVAKAIHDGSPAGFVALEGVRKGRPVVWLHGASSMPPAGVRLARKVQADHFVTLAPGKSLNLYWREFNGRYDVPSGKDRNTKQDYAAARQTPLEPGEYSIRARYQFARNPEASRSRRFALEFPPEAKARYQSAWTGEVAGKATFHVVD
jgi:hypothetical protein